jgi:hypothetical protein
MTGAPLEGARDRPDFVRRGERCWIDGDLIRLCSSPVGGIRPGGRAGPIPWLIDLRVLEEAMQWVYGRYFRLGDRIPVLQMAVDALAAGDRAYAAELADAVEFPPFEYPYAFRNACIQFLNWGPAHRRGNPRVDVDAWRARKQLERKYDPNQPRVPRGHPDGGQWVENPFSADGANSDLDRPVSDGDLERAADALLELDAVFRRSGPDPGLLHLAGGPRDPLDPLKPREPPSAEGQPGTRAQLAWRMIERLRPVVALARRSSRWAAVASILLEYGFPKVVTYFDEPKSLAELRPKVRVEDYDSFEEFQRKNPAGPGYEWHHIRERSFGSVQGWEVHSTENIVRVPVILHRRISATYSSKSESLGGLTVREWLKLQGPESQQQYGEDILRRVGVMR